MKAKVFLFFVCVSLLIPISALGTQTTPVQLSATANRLLENITDERARADLPSLTHDIIYSDMVEKNLPKVLVANDITPSDSALAVDLGFRILDWHRAAFVAIDASLDATVDKLFSSQSFKRALTDPEYTHVLVGSARDISGETIAMVCFIQRFVNLDPLRAEEAFGGPSYLTISGDAPGASLLRFTFYKGTELPNEYRESKSMSVEVVPGKDGRFEVTLPISKFGVGEYRIVIYVKLQGSDDLSISNFTRFTVSGPIVR